MADHVPIVDPVELPGVLATLEVIEGGERVHYVRLHADTIEAIAQRVVTLLNGPAVYEPAPDAPRRRRR